MTKHVAVLQGGLSGEKEISRMTGDAVAEALHMLDYKVSQIEVDRDICTQLYNLQPDVVFNALHGTFGEDGSIPGMLECLGIPYTHSGVLASALAMDKKMAKHYFQAAGLPCAADVILSREQLLTGAFDIAHSIMARDYVVKPLSSGSSLDIYCFKAGQIPQWDATELQEGEWYMVEAYIPGKELTVAVHKNEPLGVMEIKPEAGFFDYESKYTKGQAAHIYPAQIPEIIYEQAMHIAKKAHDVLGCRTISRADMRYDEADGIILLEVNTHPGLTPVSLVPDIAKRHDITFTTLVSDLVEDARCDHA